MNATCPESILWEIETDPEEGMHWRSPAQNQCGIAEMPLTSALLLVSANGISFATPGHRCGRSYRLLLEQENRVD